MHAEELNVNFFGTNFVNRYREEFLEIVVKMLSGLELVSKLNFTYKGTVQK